MFHLQAGGHRIIDVREICYVERYNRKNFLCTGGESLRITNYTMRELEEMLSQHGFFLSHQSFILSLYRVNAIRSVGRQLYEAVLRGCEKPIPVSRDRYSKLLQALEETGVRLPLLPK